MEYMIKVTMLRSEVVDYISAQCQCDFMTEHINQIYLLCSQDETYVIAKIQILANNISFSANELISILEDWADTQPTLSILGDFLVVVNGTELPDCFQHASTLIPITISTSLSVLFLLLGILSTIVVCLKYLNR